MYQAPSTTPQGWAKWTVSIFDSWGLEVGYRLQRAQFPQESEIGNRRFGATMMAGGDGRVARVSCLAGSVHKVVCKKSIPHKHFSSSFIVTNTKNKLTDLCGS